MLAFFLIPSSLAAPGDHLSVGKGLLTPSAAVGVEYSSNPYRTSDAAAADGATDMRLGVGADLTLEQPQTLAAMLFKYDLRKYFGEESSLDRYDDFRFGARIDTARTSLVGFRGAQQLENLNFPVDAEWSVHPYTTQLRSSTSLGMGLRPTSTIDASADGTYEVDYYRITAQDEADPRTFNTRHTFGPRGDLAWKFLPRTALTMQAEYLFSTWTASSIAVSADDAVVLPDSETVRVIGGLRGQVTERVALKLDAGYGSAVFDETVLSTEADAGAADIAGGEKLILGADVAYKLTPDDTISLGYHKDFRPSYFTNYVAFHRGYVGMDLRLGARFALNGEGSLGTEAYRGDEERDDVVLSGRIGGVYEISSWARLSLSPVWSHRTSSKEDVGYDDVTTTALFTALY